MNRLSQFSIILLLLFSATGCVSKRKYVALDNDLKMQRETSQNYRLRIDSLNYQNAQLRDSIAELDSLLVLERNKARKAAPKPNPPVKKSTLSVDEEYSKKSVFISTFAKNVIWPDKYLSDKFIIGVVGDSPLYEQMRKTLQGKRQNGKIIEIRKFTVGTIVPVHILFIAHSEIGNFQKIKSAIGTNPVLLVTEEGERGFPAAHINFYLNDTKVQYSLNKAVAEDAGLRITQELVRFSDK